MSQEKLKRFKKELRNSQTHAEQVLWYFLRKRSFMNYKFRRQHVIQGYIVDFVCLQKKLVIELDGSQHMNQVDYDEVRTQRIHLDGFTVLRFWNNEVLCNTNGVLEVILERLEECKYNSKS